MSQISKLYKFCFRKIFKKNLLRVTIVALVLAVTWFVVPYLFYRNEKKIIVEQLKSGEYSRNLDKFDLSDENKEKILTSFGKAAESFQE